MAHWLFTDTGCLSLVLWLTGFPALCILPLDLEIIGIWLSGSAPFFLQCFAFSGSVVHQNGVAYSIVKDITVIFHVFFWKLLHLVELSLDCPLRLDSIE